MSNTIVNINNINFEESNVIYVNGLTLERIKIKYPWLLNAKIKDAIIGEDDYGLVWYFGDWLCGEWIDGTWYSGTFHQGNWNNGRWFSYKLNKFDIVNEKFIIEANDSQYSKFLNGKWLNGKWFNGTFGQDNSEDWNDYQLYRYTNTDYLNIDVPNFKLISNSAITKNVATWLNGYWNDGVMYDSIWDDGVFNNGQINNSMWIKGNFYYGIFNGHSWFDGNWYNGEFIKGKWFNGIFTKLKEDKLSRFGSTKENTMSTICEWYDGEWKNGDFFSGIKEINNEFFSINNKISIWYGGEWKNGIFYGGHFKAGNWYNGIWKNGIFGNINTTEWVKPDNVYEYVEDKNIYFDSSYSGLTNLGTYWSGSSTMIESGLTNNTANTFYEQKYLELNYSTILGGWSGNTGVITNGTGTSSITICIRDDYDDNEWFNYDDESEYVDNDNVYHPMTHWKKRDFTYELLENDSILEIGGSGFTVSSVTYDTSEVHYIVHDSVNPSQRRIVTTQGFTKVLIKEYTSTLANTLSNLSGSTVNIYNKEKIKYELGDGDNRTYFEFDKVINHNSYMTFVCTISGASIFHETTSYSTVPGRQIFVDQNREIFVDILSDEDSVEYIKGPNMITNIELETSGPNIGKYYFITKRRINCAEVEVSGRIVDLIDFKKRQSKSLPKNIIFQDFSSINLNLSNINELKGISLRINKKILNDGIGDIYDYNVLLPFKNLKFKELNSSHLLVYNSADKPSYDPYYFGSYDDYKVLGEKIFNSKLLEGNQIYGNILEKWGLDDLKYYYPIYNLQQYPFPPTLTGFNPDDYDIKNFESVKNNIRLSFSFQVKDVILKSFQIKDVEMRLYYSDYTTAIWYDGTFEKGLWINGEFKNGNLISGMIIEGIFDDGYVGFESNSNRQIESIKTLNNINYNHL